MSNTKKFKVTLALVGTVGEFSTLQELIENADKSDIHSNEYGLIHDLEQELSDLNRNLSRGKRAQVKLLGFTEIERLPGD